MQVTYTEARGSAVEIVRAALREGEDDLVLVGGDGIVNEGVNGFVEEDRLVRQESKLTILPVGSGCDYAKTLRLPAGLEHSEEILASATFQKVDIGKASYRNLEGEWETRYFANILEAGFGGVVVDKVNRSSKLFGGRAAFMWAIVTTLPAYKNELVSVEVDGKEVAEGPTNSVIVANGRYYGSGLNPAPQAQLDDGLFDIVLFGDFRFGEVVRNLGKLRRGEHVAHPKVSYLRGRSIRAESEEEVLVEMDGELVGRLPMDVTILHRLLPVRVLSL